MDWHKVLSFSLWISPHALLGVLAVIFYRRGLHHAFPFFFAYVLYEITEFVLLFVLSAVPIVTGEQYAYAYSATLLLSIALRFAVIDEVSKDLFRQSRFLKVAARRSLLWVQGLLLAMGVLLAVYAPVGNSVR